MGEKGKKIKVKTSGRLRGFKELMREILSSKAGVVGFLLLIMEIGLVAAFPLLADPNDITNWDVSEYWEKKLTPKLAPPIWLNYFVSEKYPVTHDLSDITYRTLVYYDLTKPRDALWYLSNRTSDPTMRSYYQTLYSVNPSLLSSIARQVAGGDIVIVKQVNATYDFTAYHKPLDMVFVMRLIMPIHGVNAAGFNLYIHRPDGITVIILPAKIGYRVYPSGGNATVTDYYADFYDTKTLSMFSVPYTFENKTKLMMVKNETFQVSISYIGKRLGTIENGLGLVNALEPITKKANVTIKPGAPVQLLDVVMSKANSKILSNPEPLNGRYVFEFRVITVLSKKEWDGVEPKIMVERARVMGLYGLLGTDERYRDLWSGVVYGVRWALVIGLLSSFLSTLFGVIYGIVSAYYGGLVDAAMQRVAQIMYSLPLLPILIMLTYVMGRSIWNVILILVIFGWMGVNFVVRSMTLQLREYPFVEAARALGAGNRWIILRHLFPQVLPYMFASMALAVPGAIMSEAGISFLGLGDPSIVTWGKILHEANRAQAVLKGAWWWVLPPGLMIAVTGLTFALIGLAAEKMIQPMLRTA